MECESVNQKVLLSLESILQNVFSYSLSSFYFVVSGLKIIGHRNADSNLESHCIYTQTKCELFFQGQKYKNKLRECVHSNIDDTVLKGCDVVW
jgi:hypothetical protein